MTSTSSKLWLAAAVSVASGVAIVAWVAAGREPQPPPEVRLTSSGVSREPDPAPLEAPSTGPTVAEEVPAEALLQIELRFEKVGELDHSAEERPFLGLFTGSLAGHVLDGAAAAISGALVEVVGGPSSGRAASTSFTGSFRLDGVAAGPCDVRFSTAGTAPITRRLRIPNEGDAEIEAILMPGVPFFGRVTGTDGKGIAGATIEIEGRRATSDAAGRWTIDDVPSGNDVVVYASAPGCATQRLQAVVPVELPAEDWPGLVVQLHRGAKLEVQPRGFPLSVPLHVSVVPRDGYAISSFPAERFLDLAAPVDGTPLVIDGLPQAFFGQVLVAHALVGAERAAFPLVIGASDPTPIFVQANPMQSARARGRVLAAPSGTGAGVSDVVVRLEPAKLDAYLEGFVGAAGELQPQPSFAWLSVETMTRGEGRFEVDVAFPPPWRATVRREGFAIAQTTFGADEDGIVRLQPIKNEPGRIALVVDPARPFRVVWTRAGAEGSNEREAAAEEPAELGSFEPGIYRVERTLQGNRLAPVEIRVERAVEARLEMGWGRS